MRIGDEPLTPTAVAAAARGDRIEVELSERARARMTEAHHAAADATTLRAVYGRTTGVGANRSVAVVEGDERGHAERLLRSHAGGMGEPLAEEVVRGAILVRLAQLAAGGGGSRPELADALAGLLDADELPVLHDLGGLGTGDLTILGELGLALLQPKEGLTPFRLESGDALALMSSNAVTFAVATLAWHDLRPAVRRRARRRRAHVRRARWQRRGLCRAGGRRPAAPWCRGGRGADARADRRRRRARSDPGPVRAALRAAGRRRPARRARAARGPPRRGAQRGVGEPADQRRRRAPPRRLPRRALARWRSTHCGSRSSRSPTLSSARLRHLMEPSLTGLPAFLSADAPGSSGVLIAEYVAADALARLRADAAPSVLASATLSARARGARELRLAGRGPGAARRRPPARGARAGVARRRARAADEGQRGRRPARATRARSSTPARGPSARRRRRAGRGGAARARRGR